MFYTGITDTYNNHTEGQLSSKNYQFKTLSVSIYTYKMTRPPTVGIVGVTSSQFTLIGTFLSF